MSAQPKKKSLVTKIVEAVKPARTITCRYSVNHETWVEVDPKNLDKVIKELPVPCYLTDVTFSLHTVYESVGCGSRFEGKAGVATGTLRLALRKSDKKTGYDNLGFSPTGFVSNNQPLTAARILFLENSRFAKVLV